MSEAREARRRVEDVAFEVTGVRHVTDCRLRARLESVEEAAASAAPAADAAVESEGVIEIPLEKLSPMWFVSGPLCAT